VLWGDRNRLRRHETVGDAGFFSGPSVGGEAAVDHVAPVRGMCVSITARVQRWAARQAEGVGQVVGVGKTAFVMG
jgi:hypothetical protein